MKGIAIIGAGGFGREAYYHALGQLVNYGTQREIAFFADAQYAGGYVRSVAELESDMFEAVIAIGDPQVRSGLAERFAYWPWKMDFCTIMHPSVQILDCDTVTIGNGSIICAGVVITTNVKIGEHVHVNLNATIGHDCSIGNCVTIAPGANISGNVTIGDRVNIGTNASIREKVTIAPDVVIGMGAVVLSDITEAGTYVGVPAKKVK
jgi:sugar O-acyltransferase (sialic acid O-acetyltransferase NeuD family)